MSKVFITYGDAKFAQSKKRIQEEAKAVGWFDSVVAYSDADVSEELRATGLMNEARGGGLWSWKPDIIWQAMQNMQDGDILVYADSGCSLQKSREWSRVEKILQKKDLIAQRIFQPSYKWTRREIIDAFSDNPSGWQNGQQYCATVIILKVTPLSREFIKQWRQMIIDNPCLIKDVEDKDLSRQYAGFKENRHDQAVYSALIYKYLDSGKIHDQWERIEHYDPFCRQAIRATRLRNGESEPRKELPVKIIKRYVYSILVYPVYSMFHRHI